MKPEDQILMACASAFFPSVPDHHSICSVVKSGSFGGVAVAKIIGLSRGSSEARARLFCDTSSGFRGNFSYWLGGMDCDVLSEFPAQRLIRVLDDSRELVDWPQFWTDNGGHLFDGQMIALKWDPVWFKISAFNLPIPPFQLGSGYDIEDVDRSEAESLGFKIPGKLSVSVKVDIDPVDLCRRIANSIAAAGLQ